MPASPACWPWIATPRCARCPHGELAGGLRAIARDDERAAPDQRRLANRRRADLIATFPAALQIAAGDLTAPPCCGCWSAGRPAGSWPRPPAPT